MPVVLPLRQCWWNSGVGQDQNCILSVPRGSLCIYQIEFQAENKGIEQLKNNEGMRLGSSANQMFVSLSLFLTMTKKLVNSLKPITRSA